MYFERLIYDRGNPSRANQMNNFFLCDYCSSINQANKSLLETIEYVYSDIQPFLHIQQKLERYFTYFKIKLYIAIITITVISSFMFLVLMDMASFLNDLRYTYCSNSVVLMIITGCLALVAATGLCGMFAHTAEASGIPELKTVFSGTSYYNFLSLQTLWVKYFGSLFVKLSGLGMGYEGAFIHIQAIMGHNLLKLPFFRDLKSDHNEKMLISAGVCSAIVMAYGAPIGALLFTVEMYTSNFKVTNLIRYFISGSIAYVMYLVLQGVFQVPLNRPNIPKEYFYSDLTHFVTLGVISGLVSAAYMTGFSKFLVWKRNSKSAVCLNRYYYAIITTAIVAVIAFPHHVFKFGFRGVLNDLISYEDLRSQGPVIDWWYSDSRLIWELLYIFVVRIAMMFTFSSAAVPFGLMGPGIILGTVVGRLFGEGLKTLFRVNTGSRIFAVAGAPAFLCAVTRSFSPLICVVEITGDLDIFFPMLISSTVAFIVSSVFAIGFYDMIIAVRKLPYLASILPPDKAALKAGHIMIPIGKEKLTSQSNLFQLFDIIIKRDQIFEYDYLPIVSPKNGKLLRYISFRKGFDFLKHYEMDFGTVLEEGKEFMSYRLSMAVRGLVQEHGQYAAVFLLKQLRMHLRHIEFKEGKFVMNSMAENNEKTAREEQSLRRSVNFMSKFRRQETMRMTRAFGRDTAGLVKDEEADTASNFQLMKELLARIAVDFDHPRFEVETYPVIVNEGVSLLKVHYLFLMLNVDTVWVENTEGELTGRITQDTFLAFKSE